MDGHRWVGTTNLNSLLMKENLKWGDFEYHVLHEEISCIVSS